MLSGFCLSCWIVLYLYKYLHVKKFAAKKCSWKWEDASFFLNYKQNKSFCLDILKSWEFEFAGIIFCMNCSFKNWVYPLPGMTVLHGASSFSPCGRLKRLSRFRIFLSLSSMNPVAGLLFRHWAYHVSWKDKKKKKKCMNIQYTWTQGLNFSAGLWILWIILNISAGFEIIKQDIAAKMYAL